MSEITIKDTKSTVYLTNTDKSTGEIASVVIPHDLAIGFTGVEKKLIVTGASQFQGTVYMNDQLGIGVTDQTFKLQVEDSLDGSAGFVASIINNSTSGTAKGIRITINNIDAGGSNTYIQMRDSNNGAVGKIIGDGAGGVSYLNAFTGRHPSVTADINESLILGMIMTSTGVMWAKNNFSVSTGLPKLSKSIIDKDTAVFGILSRIGPEESGEYLYEGYVNKWGIEPDEESVIVNSIGEGLILVTDINGDIVKGDYVCSSEIAGYGRKQDDDLLHNYTVAKVTETVSWNDITETVDHDGIMYKRYLIACTYNCG
jgi:hypothetical protein